jgi:N-acetyl-anhydromuramyl-L-alanine amidase AmpD
MRRIVLHWTAGRHTANPIEQRAYHLLIEGDGRLIRGKHPISANSTISRQARDSGAYAAHVAGLNQGSIGVSLCGCFTPKIVDAPGIGSEFPLTPVQWNRAVTVCRDLVLHFGLQQTESISGIVGPTVIGHCEVEKVWGIPQSGKIDPWRPMPAWPWSLGKTPAQIAETFRALVWAEVAGAISRRDAETPDSPRPRGVAAGANGL